MSKTRQEMDPQLQWRLTDIFESDAAWEQALLEAQRNIERIESYRGRLGESADTLLELLKLQSDADRQLLLIYAYAHLHKDTDNGNSTYQGMTDRAMQAIIAAQADCSSPLRMHCRTIAHTACGNTPSIE